MDNIKGIFSYIGGAIGIIAVVAVIMLILGQFNIVSSRTIDIVIFTTIGIVGLPAAIYLIGGVVMFVTFIICLFPSAKRKKQFKQTITCTRSGTKINYYPMIVCEVDRYFFYLKCRHQKKWKNKKELLGETLISKPIDKHGIKHSFLLHANYVDTTTLFCMKQIDFFDTCEHNKISYALIHDDHIKHLERMKITDQLISNLSGEKPNIALISCYLATDGKTPAFNISYCPEQYLEQDKTLIKKGIFSYEFIRLGDRRRELKKLENTIPLMNFKNNVFLKNNGNNIFFKAIKEKIYDFAHGTNTYKILHEQDIIFSDGNDENGIPFRVINKDSDDKQLTPITTTQIKSTNLVKMVYKEYSLENANSEYAVINDVKKNETNTKFADLNSAKNQSTQKN